MALDVFFFFFFPVIHGDLPNTYGDTVVGMLSLQKNMLDLTNKYWNIMRIYCSRMYGMYIHVYIYIIIIIIIQLSNLTSSPIVVSEKNMTWFKKHQIRIIDMIYVLTWLSLGCHTSP